MKIGEYFREKLILLKGCGIIISPYLAGINKNSRFYPEAIERINIESKDYISSNWYKMKNAKEYDMIIISYALAKRAIYSPT